jgi:hypothetical protein
LDELPGDIDDEEKYLRIPGQRDLDVGKSLMLDFAREFLPMISTRFEIFLARAAPMGDSNFWWCEKASSIGGTISR